MESMHLKDTSPMLVIGRLYELERQINSMTNGRIQQLQAESTGASIVLSGVTQTYYAKQLATQVTRDLFREVLLDNDISVD